MVNTYTLEEAARVLGIGLEEARKQLKQENIREFADPSRKTWRYPAQAVDEMARRMGVGSDPQLQLGEGARKASDSPPPRKKVPDDQVDIGAHHPSEKPSSKRRIIGPKSPSPRAGSDSDVRLVSEGSDLDFQIAGDSDVKMVDESTPAPSAKSDSGVKIIPPDRKSDSDVKIVPDAADSGAVPIHKAGPKQASDSDIRLHPDKARAEDSSSDSSILTEEIDLDAEMKKAEESSGKGKRLKSKSLIKQPQHPAGAAYELSEADVDLDKESKKRKEDSSEDFVLTPGDASASSELELRSDELPKIADEEVALGEVGGGKGGSGINLHKPADSGVSLEKKKDDSSDEGSFELSLDSGPSPAASKPAKKQTQQKKKEESSSEFELSLEGEPGKKEPDSDSEFELSLDVEGSGSHPGAGGGSDSEFELTLDDSGALAPIEESGAKAEKDIFETDFEVPALEDESGQAAALDEGDTDLESSDFDIALEEGDAATEDAESGSQVVALEDEADADESAETVARPRRKATADLDSEAEVDELLEGEAEAEEEEGLVGVGAGVAAEPEPWGPVPAIGLGITAILLFLVMLMSYETIQGMWSYHTGGGVSSSITRGIGGMLHDMPKE